jgi:hypothetical protein
MPMSHGLTVARFVRMVVMVCISLPALIVMA